MEAENQNLNVSGVSPEENLPAETLEGQLAAVTAERDLLAAEKGEMYDRLLRAQAEFENARRRTERDRSEFLQFAAMDLVRQILPILDEFEKGYNFRGKLLRPAKVKVAVKP